jgi:Ca2+-transporting ATPase
MSSKSGGNFFKNEIFTNKYVWYAIAISFALLFISYQVPIVRKALDIYSMSSEDWLIAIGMSFASLIIIQISKAIKIVSQ